MTKRRSSTSKPHKQVLAKVNAYVDEGIKDLVEILNSFQGVSTYESCQRSVDNFAYVCFTYGECVCIRRKCSLNDLRKLTRFVDRLAKSYSKLAFDKNRASATTANLSGVGVSLDIFIDWEGKMDSPNIKLHIPYKLLKQVTDIFCLLKSEFG